MSDNISFRMLSLSVTIVSMLVGPCRAGGQSNGKVYGIVKDPQGAVVSLRIEIVAAESPQTQHKVSLSTDQFGKYSAELVAGEYRACAKMRGFEEACHCFHIEQGRDTEVDFSMRVDKTFVLPGDYDVLNRRLQLLAGKGAINCGHVHVNGSPSKETDCGLAAHKRKKAFLVRYDVPCGDCEMSLGLAADELGRLFAVRFDSMGMSTWELSPAQSMPDGIFTVVAPCSSRPGLRITRTGALSCFDESEKVENIMQQLDEPALTSEKPNK
jgi:hypothetical protein